MWSRVGCLVLLLTITAPAVLAGETELRVLEPPVALRQALKLDAMYRKCVVVEELPVVGSARVADHALLEAAYLVDRMLAGRSDLRRALVKGGVRVAVMAPDEFTTTIPEHRDLRPAAYWDKRARGLGATRARPAVSCGSENLLQYPGDPYQGENILVHEFGHAIHGMALRDVDQTFDDRLAAAFDEAVRDKLWEGTYSATNRSEYWAEGVQSWFDCNRRRDRQHNGVATREQLGKHDPRLAKLLAEVFRDNEWRYVTPDRRTDPGHLAGFDRARAPRFAWPAEVLRAFEEHEAKKRARTSQPQNQSVGLTFGTPSADPERVGKPVGVSGPVGCRENPRKVERLEITKPGVYENYLVDGNGAGGNRVKITADDVTLRNCEIRNTTGNGVGVFGKNVTIENCKIHHLLNGSFKDQRDAHGITGRWGAVVIRNCEIYYCSGDCIQFDPDRKGAGEVRIEDCTLWTGPLPEDAAGFKKGERPGENGVDTKTPAKGPRCTLTVRNCYLHGFNQPAQIGNCAALNLKENVHAHVEHCIFRDNEIALRLRGPGSRGGALVEVLDCAIYDTAVGVRMEDKIRDLKITRIGFGPGVARKYHTVGGGTLPGYENRGEHEAPSLDDLLRKGFPVGSEE